MIFGCGIFAFSLNSVGLIIKEIEAKQECLKLIFKFNIFIINAINLNFVRKCSKFI